MSLISADNGLKLKYFSAASFYQIAVSLALSLVRNEEHFMGAKV
jgi:hypothetical protein